MFCVKETNRKLYKNIRSLFGTRYPPSLALADQMISSSPKVNKGHGRIETRCIMTSEMSCLCRLPGLRRSIDWNATFNGGARDAATAPPAK